MGLSRCDSERNRRLVGAWRGNQQQEFLSDVETAMRKRIIGGEDSETAEKEIHGASARFEEFGAETRKLGLLTALALGVIASALGIRSIQALVDPTVFADLTTTQRSLFAGVDTLVTGALLGGGADGIHQIVETFLGFVEKHKTRIKMEGVGLRAKRGTNE